MRTRAALIAPTAFALSALAAALSAQAGGQPERLFLQQVSTHSAIVKWRGGDATRVCFSTKINDLSKRNWPRCVNGVLTEGDHMEALLTGLAPNQTYYYAVGSVKGEGQQFRTPPNSNKPPRDGNTHIWIVGDSGTATEKGTFGFGSPNHVGEAAAVRDGFNTYNAANGGEPVDLFLALGDNAYLAGTDAQWQGAFFDLYPDTLKSTPLLLTIGNHEMGNTALPCQLLGLCGALGVASGTLLGIGGSSLASDPSAYDGDLIGPGLGVADPGGMPYLNIFSLPANAESGGLASGTEQYYAVDYGNVHIVSLDSQLSARDASQRDAMKAWLMEDLAANNRDWTVVIVHHPPYSKGANHDSDTAETRQSGVDKPQFDMRTEFTPIFEQYGVDVVYSGHSHSYERSYYLQGSTGVSAATDPVNYGELDEAGNPALGRDDPYQQVSPTSGGVDDRVVYTVAGSSGKADANNGGRDIPPPAQWLRHPAHVPQPADSACTPATDDGLAGCRTGLAKMGSVVLDVTATTLSSKFVDVNGAVLDQFTITR